MPLLPLIRVLSVPVALLLCLAGSAMAAPFPTLAFHGGFPGASVTHKFCDDIDCSGTLDFQLGGTGVLPQFGLVGKTLLTAQLSYDVQVQGHFIATNNTNGPVNSHAAGEMAVNFEFGGDPGIPSFLASKALCPSGLTCFGSNSVLVLPGQSIEFGFALDELMGSLVLLPGDALFPQFLGGGNVSVNGSGFVAEHGNVTSADCPNGCRGLPLLAPILLFGGFSGSFDVTYRYCTPGVDLGCPDATPGFNSPVPAPATFFLFAAGFAVVMAGASRRRQP